MLDTFPSSITLSFSMLLESWGEGHPGAVAWKISLATECVKRVGQQ